MIAEQVSLAEQVGLSTARLGRVNDLMQRSIDKGVISGAVTLVARKGHIAHLQAHGQMDIAAGIVASRRARGPVATVAIEAMKFLQPIHLRDLISVYAEVERVGRTSMGVRIEVIAHRDLGATEIKVTEGLFTFVALDENHRPRAVGIQ